MDYHCDLGHRGRDIMTNLLTKDDMFLLFYLINEIARNYKPCYSLAISLNMIKQ